MMNNYKKFHFKFENEIYELDINYEEDTSYIKECMLSDFSPVKFYCIHRRYSLGINHGFNDPDALLEDLYIKHNKKELSEKQLDKFRSASIKEQLEMLSKKVYALLPVYMYEHSGITIATTPFGCRFDSGQCGFALIEEKYRNKKQAIEEIEHYIKQYDDYLQSEYVCINIKKFISESNTWEYDDEISGKILLCNLVNLSKENICDLEFVMPEYKDLFINLCK